MECIYEIIIYDISHIKKIYEALSCADKPVRLSTPPAAVAYAGVDYFLKAYQSVSEAFPAIKTQLVIDCGPYAGYAMAALRAGAKYIYVDIADKTVLDALTSMAQKVDAVVLDSQDRPQIIDSSQI
jgi:hypothetical protein